MISKLVKDMRFRTLWAHLIWNEIGRYCWSNPGACCYLKISIVDIRCVQKLYLGESHFDLCPMGISFQMAHVFSGSRWDCFRNVLDKYISLIYAYQHPSFHSKDWPLPWAKNCCEGCTQYKILVIFMRPYCLWSLNLAVQYLWRLL